MMNIAKTTIRYLRIGFTSVIGYTWVSLYFFASKFFKIPNPVWSKIQLALQIFYYKNDEKQIIGRPKIKKVEHNF